MANPIDHLVYAVPDLAAGVKEFARLTGVAAVPGGRHVGKGTANYLVGLGGGSYLEIIGPDPDADLPPALFGLDQPRAARLVTWAIRSDDIDESILSARAHGYDPGPADALSRRAGDTLLQWRLTPSAGVLPFLIDWGDTRHPSDSGLPELELSQFAVMATDPDSVRAHLDALDSRVKVEPASEDGLSAWLSTPRGPVLLTS